MFAAIPPINNPVVTGLVNANQEQTPQLFAKFFAGIVGLILVIASVWAFVHFILGGIEWMSSGGDKGKVEAAQHHLTSAIVGLVIVFASWSIYIVLLQVLGISSGGVGGGFSIIMPKLIP
jgi:hypothetical protein